ncbi:class D beta-lactamase [Phenylobacterium immobile]|uniref:class D beta-lactamase n=1 Tax=Phenylobacterium immobile TaxID=21 RepID=UPI000AEEF4B2|nr:class D beta-lactamase [Phenylobacterium immobile]
MIWRILLGGLAAGLVLATGAEARVVCTVAVDAVAGQILVEQGDCSRQVTPASTFKIAISLMGYDAGVLKDEHNPVLPFKPGYPDWRPAWRQPTDPARWMRESVVWYSQQVTQALGAKRLSAYVSRFDYGDHDLTGSAGKDDGLTTAWLSSSLHISPLGQVQFLRKVVRRTLPVSRQAYDMTDRITRIDGAFDGWMVHGKTGAGAGRSLTGAYDARNELGWFVGWATKGDRKVVFARLIQNDGEVVAEPAGFRARATMLKELPAILAKAN